MHSDIILTATTSASSSHGKGTNLLGQPIQAKLGLLLVHSAEILNRVHDPQARIQAHRNQGRGGGANRQVDRDLLTGAGDVEEQLGEVGGLDTPARC